MNISLTNHLFTSLSKINILDEIDLNSNYSEIGKNKCELIRDYLNYLNDSRHEIGDVFININKFNLQLLISYQIVSIKIKNQYYLQFKLTSDLYEFCELKELQSDLNIDIEYIDTEYIYLIPTSSIDNLSFDYYES